MKRLSFLTCLLSIFALLCLQGCQSSVIPPDSTPPPTTAGTTAPPETTVPPTTAPQNLSWLSQLPEPLPYSEFFSEVRSFPDEIDSYGWVVGTKTYCLMPNEDGIDIGYAITQHSIYQIPNTKELTDFRLFASTSQHSYLVFEKEIVELEHLTGEHKVIFSADRILGIDLLAHHVLCIGAEVDGDLQILRLYLPSNTLDVLYTGKGEAGTPYSFYKIFFADKSTGVIFWKMMNPEFYPLIREVLLDPNSPYRDGTWANGKAWILNSLDTLWDPNVYDVNKLPDINDFLFLSLCEAVQEETGVPVFLTVDLDCSTLEVKKTYDQLDECWFGCDFGHSHRY